MPVRGMKRLQVPREGINVLKREVFSIEPTSDVKNVKRPEKFFENITDDHRNCNLTQECGDGERWSA
jgi:hypothetical protein